MPERMRPANRSGCAPAAPVTASAHAERMRQRQSRPARCAPAAPVSASHVQKPLGVPNLRLQKTQGGAKPAPARSPHPVGEGSKIIARCRDAWSMASDTAADRAPKPRRATAPAVPHAGSSLLEFPWAWKGLKPPTGATPFVRPPSPPPSSIAPARKRPPSKKPLSQVLRERWDESAYQDLNGEGRHGELSPEKRKLANRKIEVDERGFAVRRRAARPCPARSLPPPLSCLFIPAPDLCHRLRGAHRS